MLSSTILSLFSILLTFATAEDGAKLIGPGMKCKHANEDHYAFFSRKNILDVLGKGCRRYLDSQAPGFAQWTKKVAFPYRTAPIPFKPENYGLKFTQPGPFLIWRIPPDKEPDVKDKHFIVLSYQSNSPRPCDFAAIVTKHSNWYFKCEQMKVYNVHTRKFGNSYGLRYDSSSDTDSSRRSGEGSTSRYQTDSSRQSGEGSTSRYQTDSSRQSGEGSTSRYQTDSSRRSGEGSTSRYQTDSSRRSGEGSTNQSRASRLMSPSPQSEGSTSRPPVYRSSGKYSHAESSHRSESGSSRPRTPPPKTPYPREKLKLKSGAFNSFIYPDNT